MLDESNLVKVQLILLCGGLEMERVFASAFANNPQKFYIRVVFASAAAADETSALTFASAL